MKGLYTYFNIYFLYKYHWRIQGACPAHAPDIQNFRNVTISGVHAPYEVNPLTGNPGSATEYLINLKFEMCVPVSVCPHAMMDSWIHCMLPVESLWPGRGYTQKEESWLASGVCLVYIRNLNCGTTESFNVARIGTFGSNRYSTVITCTLHQNTNINCTSFQDSIITTDYL